MFRYDVQVHTPWYNLNTVERGTKTHGNQL